MTAVVRGVHATGDTDAVAATTSIAERGVVFWYYVAPLDISPLVRLVQHVERCSAEVMVPAGAAERRTILERASPQQAIRAAEALLAEQFPGATITRTVSI